MNITETYKELAIEQDNQKSIPKSLSNIKNNIKKHNIPKPRPPENIGASLFLSNEELKSINKYKVAFHTSDAFLGFIEKNDLNEIKFVVSNKKSSEFFSLETNNLDNFFLEKRGLFKKKYIVKILFKKDRNHTDLYFNVPSRESGNKYVLALSNLIS